VVPILEQQKYDIRPEKADAELIQSITVQGPNEKIDDIDSGKVKLRAEVTLSGFELATAADSGEAISVPVHVKVPPGVEVPPQQQIKIRVTRRKEATPALPVDRGPVSP